LTVTRTFMSGGLLDGPGSSGGATLGPRLRHAALHPN
jgi:hypothetical protein